MVSLTACETKPQREVIENWSPSQAKVVGFFITENDTRWKQKEEKFYENEELQKWIERRAERSVLARRHEAL